MENTQQNSPLADEDESFVILGSSPSNLFSHINFVNSESNLSINHESISENEPNAKLGSNSIGEEENKSLFNLPSSETSLEFKVDFKLGNKNDVPSESSMVMANSIISEVVDENSIRMNLGMLLDENLKLREKNKENIESFKKQFKTITSWYDDMSTTHKLAMSKLNQTKDIIVKLRIENQRLRTELETLKNVQSIKLEQKPQEVETQKFNSGSVLKNNSPTTSVYEFIVKRDEDTIDKLTSQLELVEKQRRQVIEENEKLHWQIESMDSTIAQLTKEKSNAEENILILTEKLKSEEVPKIDETALRKLEDKNSKMMAELKSAQLKILDLENAKLNHSIQREDKIEHIKQLKINIQEHQESLKKAHELIALLKQEKDSKIDETALKKLEEKNDKLVAELKSAQVKILELENAKLNHSIQRNDKIEHIKLLKTNIQELQERLKNAHTVVFQPMRYSLSVEGNSERANFGDFEGDVKLYDRTLKHLSDFLNLNSRSVCEVCEAVNACLNSVCNKNQTGYSDELVEGMANLRLIVHSQQDKLLEHQSQIKATLTIFEKIFQNYKDVLVLFKNEREEKAGLSDVQCNKNKLLTAAESELTVLRGIIANLKDKVHEKEAFKVQLDIYKSDFEAEQRSRQEIAREKETIATELKMLQRRHQILQQELERFHLKYPESMSNPNQVAGVSTVPKSKYEVIRAFNVEYNEKKEQSPPLHSSYFCPVCNGEFKSLKSITDHVDSCVGNTFAYDL